jgi:predicted alpha/beta hydrolase family esterase
MFVRSAPRILILPGWQNSGPQHWQSRVGACATATSGWNSTTGMRPLRGDWVARLEEVLLARSDDPVGAGGTQPGLPAQVPPWAAHSQQHQTRSRRRFWWRPPDVERDEIRASCCPGWAARGAAGAAAVLFDRCCWAVRNDPYCSAGARPPVRARHCWGSAVHGHTATVRPHQCRLRPGQLARRSCAVAGPDERLKEETHHGHQETQGPRPRTRSPARPQGRGTGRSGTARSNPGLPASLRLDRHGARHVPAPHPHGRRRAVRAGREHQGPGHHAADPRAQARRRRRAPTPASTKSLPASGASAPPGWPGWTACRCWCATCPTRPPPPWR